MKKMLSTLGDLVHALQRERGCLSIFLYSEGKLFYERMSHQFSITDEAVQSLQERLKGCNEVKTVKPEVLQRLERLSELCRDLPQWRDQITERTVSVSDCINHYSHRLVGSILQSMIEIVFTMGEGKPASVSMYNAFLHWKECIGLERAFSARGIVNHSLYNEEFVDRMLFLLSEQENYQDTCFTRANETQRSLLVNALKFDESMKLDQIHGALRNSQENNSLHDLTPESWFDLISAKIDALHEAEKMLIDIITEETPPPKKADILIQHPQRSAFAEYEGLIASLPIFSNLTAEDIHSLLDNSHIQQCNKGKALFLEGDSINRFYVVLEGWVKVFKATANGEEIILQMLGSGDPFSVSAVFLDDVWSANAQVVKNATLLSMPVPLLKDQIKANNKLALNLLTTMSRYSQELIWQVENIRLRTAEERVGWFLLKLLLKQGGTSRRVDLPYGKSLIASYLGMKRETFSRTLQSMKKKGFEIQKNTIMFPEPNALCSFCGQYTAEQCSLHFSPNCPNMKDVAGDDGHLSLCM